MAAAKKTGAMVIRTTMSSVFRSHHSGITILTNLHNEPAIIPWIVPHQNPPNVSQDLSHTSQKDASHKTPGPVSNAEPELYDGADCVEDDYEDGEGQAGSVAVDAELDGTD